MINKKNILNLKKRKEIYNFIEKNPGVHLREISRRMKIPFTTVGYHLNFMNRHNLVNKKNENGYARYFVYNKFGKKEKDLLDVLRQKVPREILMCLFFHLSCSQQDLSKLLEKDPKTISYHINKLLESGIINKVKTENGHIHLWNSWFVLKRDSICNEILYSIKEIETCEAIYEIVILYKNSFKDIDTIHDFLNLEKKIIKIYPKKKARNVNSFEMFLDLLLDKIYDIMPHPYHI